MKLLTTLFLFFTLNVSGQAPLDLKFYLANIQISKTAKDFYHGRFKATDDDKTLSIMDSLNTKNNLTRPFYIFLVSKMADKSDGALSEAVGESCKEFIESHPDYLIDFLYSKNKIIDNHFLDNWANLVAGEFMIVCEGEEKKCIQKSLQKAIVKVKVDNKFRLIAFYKKVESYFHQ